jgi:DNA invertase Pin-like site-specific DNA recombinase
MTKAAIYARYSSDMQSAVSIEDQVHVCDCLIQGRGWVRGQVYSDMAISGSTHHRPGFQQLLTDAQSGHFGIVLAESIDRLSRDQEHIAALYKQLPFLGIPMFTVAEGEINEMHIGLKGTMSALYIKDLAQKTRRGLEGRIRGGKSAGGNSYGYRVVSQLLADGTATTGEREVDARQAEVVRRIFSDYVTGQSSRAIASRLNAEGIPGPRGTAWGASTIHGNPKRGTGILNNELYVGKLVWNRQRFIKDPATGRRQARPNPPDQWCVTEVPDLRIVDDDLWDAAKARQEGRRHDMRETNGGYRPERAKRQKYLFSGLLRCGQCGASYTLVRKTRYGYAAARNKGTCKNRRTIERIEVETRVLDGLKNHLLHPDLLAEFVDEFRREYEKSAKRDKAKRAYLEKELAGVRRQIGQMIDAITEGMFHASMKEKMTDLETRKAALETELAGMNDDAPIRLHPGLADVYRQKVAKLTNALNAPDTRGEATELIRSLLSEIRLIPQDTGHGIELVGELAGILALSGPDGCGGRI